MHMFGIRHHGPGSARSLLAALEALQPDCLLIEGPPEGESVLHHLSEAYMEPPLALLSYVKDNPQLASIAPFARYSPEWQALQYASREGLECRLMDLPLAHSLALRQAEATAEPEHSEDDTLTPADSTPLPTSATEPTTNEASTMPSLPPLSRDPLAHLAHAAGYSDGERWWGQMIEERLKVTGVFDAIREAMHALRDAEPVPNPDALEPSQLHEAQREASMRRILRKAVKDGYQRIAVICGAWHVPALERWDAKGQRSQDSALLKGLPKCKVVCTWIPYTSGRLARRSGYGAGIVAPGWYDHLWHYGNQPQSSSRWLARVANLLRAHDITASSAQVIDATRLAEATAALRGRAVVGLDELNEAAEAVFANGNPRVLQLIHEQLIIADTLGSVSAQVPTTPLQRDVEAQQKRLRLKPEALEKLLELDLRKPNDLARSRLLYRLRLLGIAWGRLQASHSTGTFKEVWHLVWLPEYTVQLIEAGRYGQTLTQASSGRVAQQSLQARDLAELSALLHDTLLADLPQATGILLQRLETRAAQDYDIQHLMQALPEMLHVLRYGDVRSSHPSASELTGEMHTMQRVAERLLQRVYIGLPQACQGVDDEAANQLFRLIQDLHQALRTFDDATQQMHWQKALSQLAARSQCHPLLLGASTKLRLDSGTLASDAAAQALRRALSDPDTARAASWLEGFLHEGGLLVAHDASMFAVIDSWLYALPEDTFVRVLPLLRRIFSNFSEPEREAIGRRARRGSAEVATASEALEPTRAQTALNHFAALLAHITPSDSTISHEDSP